MMGGQDTGRGWRLWRWARPAGFRAPLYYVPCCVRFSVLCLSFLWCFETCAVYFVTPCYALVTKAVHAISELGGREMFASPRRPALAPRLCAQRSLRLGPAGPPGVLALCGRRGGGCAAVG